MALAASIAARKLSELLTSADAGLGPAVAGLAEEQGIEAAAIAPECVVVQNSPVAIAERSAAAKYPAVHIYCDRLQNLLTEKFRVFSGTVRMVAEVRVSQDRLEGLEDQTRVYVEAVTQVLDSNRGSWGQGMFFTGGYEVKFEPVQHGGRNFLQIARVAFEVDVSR